MSIIVARHGQTEWNAEGKVQGQLNSPLTSLGNLQASFIGDALKIMLYNPKTLISSDLGRARQTSEKIAEILGFSLEDIKYDQRMRELNLGEKEGTIKGDAKPEYIKKMDAQVVKDKYRNITLNGESYKMAYERVRPLIEGLNPNVKTLLVGHEAINRMILMILGDLSVEKALSIKQPNNYLYKFELGEITHLSVGKSIQEWEPGILTKTVA